jgi:hypothetical protein
MINVLDTLTEWCAIAMIVFWPVALLAVVTNMKEIIDALAVFLGAVK